MLRYTPLIFTLVILLGSATTLTQAQRMQLPAEERAKRLKDSLSLSEEQTASVVKIYQEMDQKRKDLRDSSSDDRQARMKAMRSLVGQTDEKIEALLTPDQKTKYDDMKKNRQDRGQGSRRRPNG